MAYNKDNQEDKEPLFDTLDTLKDSLTAYANMVPAIKANKVNMQIAATQGFATATDLADYLVKKGMPFRDAHEVVGKVVAHCIEHNKGLDELALEELQKFSAAITNDVSDVLTLEGSVNSRNHIGGTAPSQVKVAITNARVLLAQT